MRLIFRSKGLRCLKLREHVRHRIVFVNVFLSGAEEVTMDADASQWEEEWDVAGTIVLEQPTRLKTR